MKEEIMVLPRNRVRRNYRGGAGIDRLHGETICVDTDRPEEWIGSMTEASNPGLPPIPGEGLCMVPDGDRLRSLREIVDEEKTFYLGESLRPDGTWQLSFLFKILDSSMRLHVQAHPSTAFANARMGKPYGKLECYYILDVRENINPYIRLGFQHAPSKEEWADIIRTQDLQRMDACFEKIAVQPGEVWYIPGGMPHAIGEGITLLEIMEPSDLVVRCEFEREGILVPPEARFMGLGLDFCLDIFDYTSYSPEVIRNKCRIPTQWDSPAPGIRTRTLIDDHLTPCFFVKQFSIQSKQKLIHEPFFTLCVVTNGEGTICGSNPSKSIQVRKGDSFLVAAANEILTVETKDQLEWVAVRPGTDMKNFHSF